MKFLSGIVSGPALCAAALPAAFFFPAALQAQAPAAHPFLHPLFSDNMVLQREQSDPVWGWTTPGATCTVTVAGKTAKAVAGADGRWTAKLPPLPVGGPYTLTVKGPETVRRTNVLVGDVWICSGQSNMEFGVGNGVNAQEEIAAAKYPNIRLFTVQHNIKADPQDLAPAAPWAPCTPDSIRQQGQWNGFSAVGYFFGRDLHRTLHIPIGLIQTVWGGTPAEAWTSGPALAKMPDFASAIAQRDAQRGATAPLAQRMTEWYAKNDPGLAGKWADPATKDGGWPAMPLPGVFQSAGVPELAKFNGVIWYRKDVDLSAEAAAQGATLRFVADDNDTAWVNGVPVGATEGYQALRAYKIPASALKAGRNVIAVRVLDTGGVGGIYGDPAGLVLDVPGGQSVPLAGQWRYKVGVSLASATPLPLDTNGDQNAPTVLFNGMVNPLIPFGIKGAIWYQGESNAGRAYQYKTLLPTMIGDWRTRWGGASFPFYIVQLANFNTEGDAWPELREAQWLTAKNLSNSGLATAIDVGNPTDIHPTNKQEVGRRLALVAEAKSYGKSVEYSGPIYKGMTVQGGAVRLSFTHLGGGLKAKTDGPLTGFLVAGADQKFVPAQAKIDGDSVLVSSPDVSSPAAVRYAWTGNPAVSLYNKAGLPALPFRTDDWAWTTQNNR